MNPCRHRFRPTLEALDARIAPAVLHGDLVLGPTDQFDVSLTRRDTNPHHRLRVVGGVEINDATLNIVAIEKNTRVGDAFIVIDNDGTDPVSGTFAGLPEGGTITTTEGARYRISYAGGDGNDVVLTRVNVAPTFINRTLTSVVFEGSAATLTGTIIDPDPQYFYLTVNWGDGVIETYRYGPDAGGTTVSVTHVYADDDGKSLHDVTFSWRDPIDFGNSAVLQTEVRNVAPVIQQLTDVTIGVGQTLQRVTSFSDPGLDRWVATVDWGDGSAGERFELTRTGRFGLSHQYTRPGFFLVTVNVADDDGGVGTMSFWVTVR
jgi:hypothetical protein